MLSATILIYQLLNIAHISISQSINKSFILKNKIKTKNNNTIKEQ